MASNFGVVAYITPPSLKGVTQPDLIEFETEYSAYKENVSNVNAGRDQDELLPVATVKDCIDGPTLHALCIMGKIDGATTLEQATAAKVAAWFNAAYTEAPRDLSERIHSAVSSVVYKPSKVDPSGAALTFCLDVVKAIDKNNASEILQDREKGKYLIDKLEAKLEPPLLRERVRMKRATWTKAEQGNISLFQECASKLAVDVAQNELARTRIGGKKRGSSFGGDNSSVLVETELETDKDTNGQSMGAIPGPSKQHKSRDIKSQGWTAKCLNLECGEIHRVKDCEKNSKAMKRALMTEHMEKKRAAKRETPSNSD